MDFVSIFVVFIPLVVAGALAFSLGCGRPFLDKPVVLNTE